MLTEKYLRIEKTVVDDTKASSNRNSTNVGAIRSSACAHGRIRQEGQRHSGWPASLHPQHNKLLGLQRTLFNHVRGGQTNG